ncbi:DNA-binding response regulator [Cohnella zeiphila]|uniref:DNA-binding response regulator n=1 Tax=Cohnella zeiphila TaxID=2761120 RepID=A0A7X0SJH3_9BACL|nr:DNA-binding response regulator [Cohnella zeiphila]MBB6731117.1 DNA-binding response regulator [Cohnella zeiphila]
MKKGKPGPSQIVGRSSRPNLLAHSPNQLSRSSVVRENVPKVRKSATARHASGAELAANAASFAYLPFETAHPIWLKDHVAASSGERRRRLEEGGHGHAEKEMLRTVWLPAFGHLEHLHPEFEITDFQGGSRFIDLAYIRPPHRVAIEIDGYGPHWKDASRRQFCDERVRAAHLINDGWIVIRIGYDDLKDRPRLWQQILQQLIGNLYGQVRTQDAELYSQEQEILRLAARLERAIRISDVRAFMQCGYIVARRLIRQLEDKELLLPVGGGLSRAHCWVIKGSQQH